MDDEAMVLEAGSRMLEKLGFTILRAGGGQEAIDIFRQKTAEIDLVMLDIVMPEIGGEEAFRRIKKIKLDVKVLVSSGYDCSGRMPEILKEDGNGFIQKPFNLFELSRMVRRVLDKGSDGIVGGRPQAHP